MSFLAVYGTVILAATLGGGSAGLLGVFVVGLRMPFLAVCAAHAAMAGAVVGMLLGAPAEPSAFAGALAGAALLGWILRRRSVDPNVALGSLFSLMLGVAFLGIGLSEGPRSAALGLMWGSLLFVTRAQLVALAIVAALLVGFVVVFDKELKAILFSRELASALLPEGLVFGVLLALCAGVITVNLETVGGLLLYSLIANPAVAALRVARGYRSALVLSAAFGALSALAGFLTAYAFALPVGACIVLSSSLLLGATLLISCFRRSAER